jgi:hypothetical protein
MALAVVSRTRWLQEQLAANMKAQQAMVEDQNRKLEATVAERTAELASQHKALDEAHQMLVGSVNYASRLQRGQLPRPLRLEGRFASFDVIWEPRDTIGGDLWWISSSQHKAPSSWPLLTVLAMVCRVRCCLCWSAIRLSAFMRPTLIRIRRLP